MNRAVIFSIIIGVIIVALVLFFVMKKDKEVPAAAGEAVSPAGLPSGSYPLKKGDKNRLVMDLQAVLNSQFSAGLGVDGDFGPKTEAAAKNAYKLVIGQAAPATLQITKDLVTKFSNYTPVAPREENWRTNTWIDKNITQVNRLTKGGLMAEVQAASAVINSMARFSDPQLKQAYTNYKDKYFVSMTADLGKYTPGTGTKDGYKILMAKLNQLNLK